MLHHIANIDMRCAPWRTIIMPRPRGH